MKRKDLTKKDISILLNFVEEFSWVSNKFNSYNLSEITSSLLNSTHEENNNDIREFLAGYLPKILMDREVFARNKDIYSFASSLDIYIKNPEKRSREELIGIIVCNVYEKDLSEINKAYKVVTGISKDPNLMAKIKKTKSIDESKDGVYDWNYVIKEIFNKE
mgnify:CR=1 FL=1